MSRIIVKFRKPADYDTRTEQAVSFICHLFGFASPWFNDDAWFDDNRRTLIIGSGHVKTDLAGKINALRTIYEEEIEEIYEELDDDEQSELKPCPFCGCTDIMVWRISHIGPYSARCPNCITYGPQRRSEEEATAAWNRRAKE